MTAKTGLNGFGNRLMEILSQAERSARAEGTGRRVLASRLGISEHTLAAWFKPSRAVMIPADRLFELACREDLLPDAVRHALWASLGAEGGYIILPESTPESSSAPPLLLLAELAAAVGNVASSLRDANGNGSGRMAKDDEALIAVMIGQLREVGRHAARMRMGFEGRSGAGNGTR